MKYNLLLKSISHYILLVGIPLLGVLIIIQLGSRLVAPVSVGGDWQLAIDGSRDCLLPAQPGEPPVLRISQSGHDLLLAFGNQTGEELDTRLDGQTLRTVGIGSESSVTLIAEVDRDSEPNRLEGEISAPGCPAPLHFSATRLPKTVSSLQSH